MPLSCILVLCNRRDYGQGEYHEKSRLMEVQRPAVSEGRG